MNVRRKCLTRCNRNTKHNICTNSVGIIQHKVVDCDRSPTMQQSLVFPLANTTGTLRIGFESYATTLSSFIDILKGNAFYIEINIYI